MLTAKERIELAVEGIVLIVNEAREAAGAGRLYDGDLTEDITTVLKALLHGPFQPIEPSDKPSDDGC